MAIARAMAAGPDILLLDEPFGALDAITRHEARRAFIALRASARVTAVLVTHDLGEALRVASRIAVMRAGRIVMETPVAEMAGRATGYAAELLARSGVSV